MELWTWSWQFVYACKICAICEVARCGSPAPEIPYPQLNLLLLMRHETYLVTLPSLVHCLQSSSLSWNRWTLSPGIGSRVRMCVSGTNITSTNCRSFDKGMLQAAEANVDEEDITVPGAAPGIYACDYKTLARILLAVAKSRVHLLKGNKEVRSLSNNPHNAQPES